MAEMKDKETLRKAIAYFIDNSYDAVDYEALAALDRMAEREKRLESVIRWALGEKDTFPVRPEDAGLFWWRSELRLRSGLFPEDETGGQAVEQSSTKEGGDANCAKHTAASDNTTGASTVTESAKPDSLTSSAAPVVETAGVDRTPDWVCPNCKWTNYGIREICRNCRFDSAQVSEGAYFGPKPTVDPVQDAGAATLSEICVNCGSNAWLSDRSCEVCGGSVSSRESGAATPADEDSLARAMEREHDQENWGQAVNQRSTAPQVFRNELESPADWAEEYLSHRTTCPNCANPPHEGDCERKAGAATPADWKDRCRNCGSNAWIGSECASCGVWESSRETSADNSSGGQIHVPQMSSPNQNEVTVEPNATERIAAALERIATALEGKC